VKETTKSLRGSGIRTVSFVDFPFGTMTGAGKAHETARLVEAGAEEVLGGPMLQAQGDAIEY